MSSETDAAEAIGGTTGSGKASVLWSIDGTERQILLRVTRGIHIEERELRYQLERKDNHPLAQVDNDRVDVLAEMKERGLIEAEMCFRLTPLGRAVLGGPGASGRAGS
jgi:hypothetical protein